MEPSDLYLDKVDFDRYLTRDECRRCGAETCRSLVDRLRGGGERPSLEALGGAKASALGAVLDAEDSMPAVPMIPNPCPIEPELVELNDPSRGDPVLVTGNNHYTQEVLLTVLAGTSSPFFVLFTDTRGDTIDMAVIFQSFTADRVLKTFAAEGVADRARGSRLVLPGFAAVVRDEIAAATGFPVEVGPVCAAELPLYLGGGWI